MKTLGQWTALAAAAVALVNAHRMPAQDWPQWRGVNRDGKVSGFVEPVTWPTNLTQKWQVNVGKGDSSPILVGERLYAFGRQETNEVVLCLNPANGRTLWEAAYPANRVVSGPAAGHPGPRSTPVAAGGKVCTLGIAAILSCFDGANGTLLWRKQSTNDYLGASTRSDPAMSPIVVGGCCIVHIGEGTNGPSSPSIWPAGVPSGNGAATARRVLLLWS